MRVGVLFVRAIVKGLFFCDGDDGDGDGGDEFQRWHISYLQAVGWVEAQVETSICGEASPGPPILSIWQL